MAKQAGVKPKSGKVRAAVFNMSAPPSRLATGEATLNPKEGKVIPWGLKDGLVHEYLRLIADSGTASMCMRRKQQFIFADGFVDPDAATFKVNETQTADALLQDLSAEESAIPAVVLRVRVVDGKVMADVLPTECVRKLDNGFFLFNPTFGQKKVDKDLNEILPAYTNLEGLKAAARENPEAIAESGQVYYLYEKVKGAYQYPVPVYASKGSLADMENDAEIALYDLDEVKNGFRLSAILTVLGNFDETVDNEGNTVPNPDFEAIKTQLQSLSDRSDRNEPVKKTMLLTADSKEMLPSLTAFTNTKALELLSEVTDRVGNKVCRNMGVPPVLVGFAKPGQLGQVQEVSNMIKLFQMDIAGTQNRIQRVFAELWPDVKDWTITSLNPVDFIPAEVLAKMTDEEIRALAGLATAEDTRPDNVKTLISNLKQLPDNIASRVMEKMSDNDLLSLVGLTPKTDATDNQTTTA